MNEEFMRAAIGLAKNGIGRVNPNPLVGAVIVRNNKIIARGFHHKYGGLHAERDALRDASENGVDVRGAEMFVTLEPCNHVGKQPPCTQAIFESGIKKVYVGSRDPNPLVSGRGVDFLRRHGISVEEDFLRDECDKLNPIFFHYITTNTPYVALKYAMTADGKIATVAGDSKWISSEASREFSHSLRNQYSCILAGIGTVLSDDPLLTCRIEGGRNPVRIICDSSLKIPLESKIVQSAKDVRTIVACADRGGGIFSNKENALKEKGIEIIRCGKKEVNLSILMQKLAALKLDSVLIEGGAKINFSAMNSGIVQKIYAFVAPKIFGGAAPTPVGGQGVQLVKENFSLVQKSFCQCGDDLLIEYEVKKNVHGNY